MMEVLPGSSCCEPASLTGFFFSFAFLLGRCLGNDDKDPGDPSKKWLVQSSPEAHLEAAVGLVLHLHMVELKQVALLPRELPRRGQVPHCRHTKNRSAEGLQ